MVSLSINKINTQNCNIYGYENPFEQVIHLYDNYCDCNDFHDLKCPLCKNNTLTYHKSYERNLSYYYNEQIINIKLSIRVCVCSHCKNNNAKQKYHAILPEFILPYSIYEASIILKAIYDYFNKIKLKDILDRLKIRQKLFYDWLKKLNKYTFSSSIILETINDIKVVISMINKNNKTFLTHFYNNYNHPFFLFRLTCTPLCLTP